MKYIITILFSFICFYGFGQASDTVVRNTAFGRDSRFATTTGSTSGPWGVQRDTPHPKAAKLYAHTIDSIAGSRIIGTGSIDSSLLGHNVGIGRGAGMFLTMEHHVIIIGDYRDTPKAKYQSCTLNYKDDWAFFKTIPGKSMKYFLSRYPRNTPLTIEIIHDISNQIFINWLPDINKWFDLHPDQLEQIKTSKDYSKP